MKIEVGEITIAMEQRGSGRPIVVIHSWSADQRHMIADLEPIFERHPGWLRFYFDLPGHGGTPAPPWLGNQQQMLEIVQSVAEQACGAEPFAVIGSSYGGYLALGIARTIPERLLGVALLLPDLPDDAGNRDVPRRTTIHADTSLFIDLAEDEQWIPSALVVHSTAALSKIRKDDMPAYRCCDREFLKRLDANYLLPAAVRKGTRHFNLPSLIALGHQDATVGFRRQMNLLDEFPRATLCVADLVGHHFGRIEQPALFDALILDWLERMEMGLE